MLNSQKGQSLVEAILLMVLFLFVFKFAMNSLKDNEFLISLIQKPLIKIASTIENGSPHNSANPRAVHPNTVYKHITFVGDEQ